MILTGTQIEKEVKNGSINIEPFSSDLVNPNSYNYRLGSTLIEIENEIIDLKKDQKFSKITIPEEGYILTPKRLYLGSTVEVIGSDKYVPSLIGRSSLGRLGLFLQITADLGHIGTKHSWTLELTCVQPIVVYPRMRIGQVSFWKPDGLDMLEGQKYIDKHNSYAHFSEPQISIFRKMLDK